MPEEYVFRLFLMMLELEGNVTLKYNVFILFGACYTCYWARYRGSSLSPQTCRGGCPLDLDNLHPVTGMSRRTGQALRTIRTRPHGKFLSVVYGLCAVRDLDGVLKRSRYRRGSISLRDRVRPMSVAVGWNLVMLVTLLF